MCNILSELSFTHPIFLEMNELENTHLADMLSESKDIYVKSAEPIVETARSTIELLFAFGIPVVSCCSLLRWESTPVLKAMP